MSKKVIVGLDKITTKVGDDGESFSSCGMSHKSDIWFDFIGALDELNALIGMAQENCKMDEKLILNIQNNLFDIGADVFVMDKEKWKFKNEYVEYIEQKIAKYRTDHLNSFMLPTGSSSFWHMARAFTRKAERAFWALYKRDGDGLNKQLGVYLNRLSDLLFVMSLFAQKAKKEKIFLWKPGTMSV